MKQFDFRSFHVRGMNADEKEKEKINKELKDLYESLSEEDKKDFNEQLQSFLIKELSSIKSVYDGVKSSDHLN